MPLTPVEIIATLFVALGLIKLTVIAVNKDVWYHTVAKRVYGNPGTSAVIISLLAITVLYYLLQELTVVQVFAAVCFSSLFVALGMLANSKNVLAFAQKAYHTKLPAWTWLFTLTWLALSFWVLHTIFIA